MCTLLRVRTLARERGGDGGVRPLGGWVGLSKKGQPRAVRGAAGRRLSLLGWEEARGEFGQRGVWLAAKRRLANAPVEGVVEALARAAAEDGGEVGAHDAAGEDEEEGSDPTKDRNDP